MTPRWDYTDAWADDVIFLGGTNAFDIYVDYEGHLRLTCGEACNDNWQWHLHWTDTAPWGHLRIVVWAPPADHWRNLFHEDRKNIEAYLQCFAPDWYERGRNILKKGEQYA